MDVEVQVPEAGFYLFPCFRRHRKALALRGISTDEQLCAQLLQDTGVAILPGSAFGRAPDELFARLAFVDFKGDLALYLIESMVRWSSLPPKCGAHSRLSSLPPLLFTAGRPVSGGHRRLHSVGLPQSRHRYAQAGGVDGSCSAVCRASNGQRSERRLVPIAKQLGSSGETAPRRCQLLPATEVATARPEFSSPPASRKSRNGLLRCSAGGRSACEGSRRC
jgi:hypothetical protein